MHSEQTLNNMSVGELLSYSETFSEVPSRVAQLIIEKAVKGAETSEQNEEIKRLDRYVADLENKLDEISFIATY